MNIHGTLKISYLHLIYVLNIAAGFIFFYVDQYIHTHVASSYSYTRPYFRAFYFFDTWSYAILFSLSLLILAFLQKDRIRALFVAPMLLVTAVFNVLFIGVNNGYYFPWNLITTEPNHWLMQWGFNIIVSIQWTLLLIGIVKNRRFTSFLVPVNAVLIVVTSLFRNNLNHLLDFGATPIELAYAMVILFSLVFTLAYLIYQKKKQIIPSVAEAAIVSVVLFVVGLVSWNAPRIHNLIPFFIFERDMALGSILIGILAAVISSKVMKRESITLHKKHVLTLVVVFVLVTPVLGAIQYQGRDSVVAERLGGKYDAQIRVTHFPDTEEFWYTKDGKEWSGYFDSNYVACLDWIRSNVAQNSVFLNWWDYGHMIRGIAEQEVIIFSPSEEILWTIQDPSQISEYSNHQNVVAVAQALTATDINETIAIMQNYNTAYIFVSQDDAAIAGVFFEVAGKDSSTYLTSEGFTDQGKETTLYKILQMTNLENFDIVYSDTQVVIYKLTV
ncbi:MAG: hypothetical protein NWF06_11400 [Candidatus Bathyarchaeota archaeon]|nr:hypothetical protein [Candidatus Bathyarchaeum sp.]